MNGRENPPFGSFKEMEREGWTANAPEYASLLGGITRSVIDPMLNAVHVVEGTRLLDVACGPGYAAGRAAARGAKAIGIDFSPAMISEARRRFLKLEFFEGDAEHLAFADNSFDAVVCAFGLLHMSEPERAIAEAYRVLRSGGRYAFTVWSAPDRSPFFALVLGAVQTHGRMDVALPPAPPLFRFADPEESRRTLASIGFDAVVVEEIPLTWRGETARAAVDMIYRSTVRTARLLELQTAEARERIDRAIMDGIAQRNGDGFSIPIPAVLVAARKP